MVLKLYLIYLFLDIDSDFISVLKEVCKSYKFGDVIEQAKKIDKRFRSYNDLTKENKSDIDEINSSYLKGLKFHFVTEMSDVIDLAVTNQKVKHAKSL